MCNNIFEKAEFDCSGCGACTAVCPKEAVNLKLNDAGFFTAVVDKNNCINCGLCKKVCTRYDEEIQGVSLFDVPLYALQSKDEKTVKRCSSGGIANELANQAICDGKQVIGVVYNTKVNQAEHRIADKADQLAGFAGSKYLQSNPEQAFRLALNHARKNKDNQYVVFGTPCQIAGFAKSSENFKVRDQFLLVEIFCHGVPSYKLWDEQCKIIGKKLKASQFDSVQFRYKKNDWHSYCLKVEADGRTYYGSREKTLFWQVFFENVLLGDSCYKCRMRQHKSMADIRLGDYWGKRFQHRSDGVSAVFACTERGREAILRLEQIQVLNQLNAGDAAEMMSAQNMGGYHQRELHDKAMEVLKSQTDVMKAIKTYRAGMSGKQKLKRILLSVSAVIPDDLRAKLRKANSSRMLKK
ncbi:MAG: Coenzyme F420 hydrogenase/dehydrogenase, beta subunit C-terminal domain [Ruminococcus sp.]|nr:Coenzyme F420 hydrogenase/dehydrogenase, beta subunit C-terminal domain [Ruminococcus sp.]